SSRSPRRRAGAARRSRRPPRRRGRAAASRPARRSLRAGPPAPPRSPGSRGRPPGRRRILGTARGPARRPRGSARAPGPGSPHKGTIIPGMSESPTAAARFGAFVELIARLRAPGGCPWDREQTHQSVKPMTIEEAYEVAQAIDEGDDAELKAELGDLLLQV